MNKPIWMLQDKDFNMITAHLLGLDFEDDPTQEQLKLMNEIVESARHDFHISDWDQYVWDYIIEGFGAQIKASANPQ